MKILESWITWVVLIGLWLATGLLPVLFGGGMDKSGQFGDSWGMATSLFSCFGFLLAAYTLLKQQRESHEMAALQKEQMRLAAMTAAIQQQTLQNSITQTSVECLTKIHLDVASMKQCALEWREALLRPRPHPDRPDDAEESRRFNVLRAELEADAMVVKFTFGSPADELVKAIDTYCDGIYIGLRQEDIVDKRGKFEMHVDKLVFALKDAMKPVWKEAVQLIEDVTKV